jgi:CDP-6-deoxy-D-xylo-4-hexulose-3-dehydrase
VPDHRHRRRARHADPFEVPNGGPAEVVQDAPRQADIGYRIITGGCITRHDVIKHYDYECVDDLPNANLAHDHGFFVGNHPVDLTTQIARLREVLDRAARS